MTVQFEKEICMNHSILQFLDFINVTFERKFVMIFVMFLKSIESRPRSPTHPRSPWRGIPQVSHESHGTYESPRNPQSGVPQDSQSSAIAVGGPAHFQPQLQPPFPPPSPSYRRCRSHVTGLPCSGPPSPSPQGHGIVTESSFTMHKCDF